VGLLIHANNDKNDFLLNDNNNNSPRPTRLLPALTAGLGGFEDYLKSQNKRNIRQILCYAQRYHKVLQTGDASELVSLSSGPIKRHAMEALKVYAKYSGSYEKWCQIRKRYSLHWTNGDESFQALQRFFNPDLSLDVMLDWVRKAIRVLPVAMATVIKFNCLTGLRPAEAVESVRLLNSLSGEQQYYNPGRQCLEHFRFPEIFLRRTKKAYISLITKEQLSGIGIFDCKTPTWSVIRHACRKKDLDMNMHYCRKIHGSWLHGDDGITADIVDFLQGRTSPSIFSRHYLTPSNDFKDRVLDAVTKLQREIEK